MIFDFNLLSPDNATSLLFIFGFVALAMSRRELLHAILVPVFLLLVLLDIFQWTFVIGSS